MTIDSKSQIIFDKKLAEKQKMNENILYKKVKLN